MSEVVAALRTLEHQRGISVGHRSGDGPASREHRTSTRCQPCIEATIPNFMYPRPTLPLKKSRCYRRLTSTRSVRPEEFQARVERFVWRFLLLSRVQPGLTIAVRLPKLLQESDRACSLHHSHISLQGKVLPIDRLDGSCTESFLGGSRSVLRRTQRREELFVRHST
jgi:hypothetical protein